MRITIGDQPFDRDYRDSDGTYWMITELDGWSAPPVRAGAVEKTYGHGSAPIKATYGPRQMTAKGVVKAATEELFWKAYNRLAGDIVDLNRSVPMTVQEDVLKHIDVVKASEVRLSFIGVGAINFEIPLTAYDPLKYGPDATMTIPAGATRSLVNDGNEPSPRVVATASATGTLILRNVETEQTLTTGLNAVEAGTVANFRPRTLYWNGLDRYGRLHSTSTWWMLQPGANRIANTGSTAVSVVYQPAWA